MSEQDDLARWADDDLVRALRAPGTAAELADEEQYVAAFREARGSTSKVRSLPRRTIGRLGAGGTAVVVTVALTSGMAAAYTGHLPDPVQQIAHSVIGAPAPAPRVGPHRRRPDPARPRPVARRLRLDRHRPPRPAGRRAPPTSTPSRLRRTDQRAAERRTGPRRRPTRPVVRTERRPLVDLDADRPRPGRRAA